VAVPPLERRDLVGARAANCLQFPERPPGSLLLPRQNENQRMQVIGREIWVDVAKDQNFDGAVRAGAGGDPGHLLGNSSEVLSLGFGISDFIWACSLVDGF